MPRQCQKQRGSWRDTAALGSWPAGQGSPAARHHVFSCPWGQPLRARATRRLGKECSLKEVTVSCALKDEEGSSMRSRTCSDATRSRVAVSAAGAGTEQPASREWTGVAGAGPRSPGWAVLWPCPQGLRVGDTCPAQWVTFTCTPCGDGRVPQFSGRPDGVRSAPRATGPLRKPVRPKPLGVLKHTLTWRHCAQSSELQLSENALGHAF